ncbi:G-protein coupled receptor Mth-like [Drosophila navojoa]|nr:G-protein coupled receptor Mth-like [Drosophila navojoa]
MGVTWTFEIVVYLVQDNKPVFSVLQVFDYINSAQGVIIFIMFVLKRSVLKLISNRIRGIEDDASDSEEEIALQDRNGGANKIGPQILN